MSTKGVVKLKNIRKFIIINTIIINNDKIQLDSSLQ
jgi:hypothetical protein